MTTTPQKAPEFINARAAAGVLFTNEQGEILMVTPSYKPYLDIPGGFVEPGESPAETARREVREELSIEPDFGRLLVIDWWTEAIEQPDGAKILFIFEGGVIESNQLNSITVDGDEIVDFGFRPVDVLDEHTVPRLANRIRQALSASREGSIRYLENGIPSR